MVAAVRDAARVASVCFETSEASESPLMSRRIAEWVNSGAASVDVSSMVERYLNGVSA